MPGIELQLSSPGRGQWSEAFRQYAEWNHRDGAELFVDQTRKLATELYTQTAAIAPSKAQIATDVKKLGWRIPVKFKDGRLGRGVAAQWVGWAWEQRKKRKGRPSKSEQLAKERFKKRPTLADMQRFVIAMRTNARLYLASGWLGAIFDLGGTLKATSGGVDRERGGAEVQRTSTGVRITLWNRSRGIETVNARRQFVAKAHLVRTADMLVYIRRKMDEAARAVFQRAA